MELHTTEQAVEVAPGTSVTVKVAFDRVAGSADRGEGKPVLAYDTDPAHAPPDPPADDAEAAAYLRSRGPIRALAGKSIEATWRESGAFVFASPTGAIW